MTIHEALTDAIHQLELHSPLNARLDAELLMAHTLGSERSYLIAHYRDPLDEARLVRYFSLVKQRCAGAPVQYLLGTQEFWGLEFLVTHDVLIPRPETEVLVEEALKLIGDGQTTVVDLGTGSGCIAVILAVERPRARVFATDLSEEALQVARANARKHGVEQRIGFLQGDLLSPLTTLVEAESVDCICSNPPYVAECDLSTLQREVRDWEPRLALIGGDTGLEVIKRLVPQSLAFLKPGGHLVMEIGFNQQDVVPGLLDMNWASIRLHDDMSGIPRIMVAQKC